jgi:hypothetical protein
MAGTSQVQFLPKNVTVALTVPDEVSAQQFTEAIRDWHRMTDPQQELPFPAILSPSSYA